MFGYRTSRRPRYRAQLLAVLRGRTKGRAQQNREWNTVLGACVTNQNHRDQNNRVGEQDCRDRLIPAHTSANQIGREQVGWDTNHHTDQSADMDTQFHVRASGAVGS